MIDMLHWVAQVETKDLEVTLLAFALAMIVAATHIGALLRVHWYRNK